MLKSRRRRRTKLLLVLLGTALLAVIFVVIGSWVFSPCHDPSYSDGPGAPNPGNECASVYGVTTVGLEFLAYWTVTREAETWTAIASGFIALFTLTLWLTAWLEVSHLRDEFVTTNRAWIFFQPWPRSIQWHADGRVSFELEFRLYGPSPATVIAIHIDSRATDPVGKAIYDPSKTEHLVFNLGPNNQWIPKKRYWTTRDKPFVVGFVLYNDQFDTGRGSKFCYRLTNNWREPFVAAGSINWSGFT
jgi:hypothetical protein